MKIRLLWKLLAINAPVILTTIVVIWIAIDFLAADYFSVLMEQYKISPSETHEMFLNAVHRYLITASIIAIALAILLSFLLTRMVLRPLAAMAEVTRKIEAGDYSARVTVLTKDEIGELGQAVNRMADSLDDIDRSRRTMVADFSHELRTPLTNIRGYLEAFADGVIAPSKETFTMLQQEILRLVRLVDDLQQLTKAESARAFLRRETLNLPNLVQQVLEFYRYQLEAKEIAVETHFTADTPTVSGDRDRLLQVLRNLTENACHYTPAGETLAVAAEATNGAVTLSFTNTGVEIDETSRADIFERFVRGDKSRSRDSGGAGIGLSIVKELVEAHGGQVGADSGEQRTRVWIRLPAG